jgi:ABC-2 type transport system permease protein
MKWSRALAIAEKEVFHISRDPFTLGLAVLLPVMLVAIFGTAIEYNVKNIPISVFDGDHSDASRRLLDTLGSSKYFLLDPTHTQNEATSRVDSEQDRAAIVINRGFEYDLLSGRGANVQLILDGSDNSTIGSVISYFGTMEGIANQKITETDQKPAVEVVTRFLYNPELNSKWFTVPGLMVIVLAILSILLTSLTVAREWENGSMELLLSTPVEPIEIIVGKLLPYLVMGLVAVGFVYGIARLGFGVPFKGSHIVFLLGTLLFLATYLAQGLLISVATRSQQVSMQIAMMTGLLPSLLLSGFTFAIDNMPAFFQGLTTILPARWFMQISRDVFLKGSDIAELKTPFIAMSIICLVMVTLANRNFKKDLEP